MALPRRHTPDYDAGPQAAGHDGDRDWHVLYEIENPSEVDAYVRRHPSLAAVLAEAPAQVRDIFEDAPRLVMRLEAEEDIEPACNELVVDILTSLDPGDVQVRLARFDADWWLTVLPGVARDGAAVVFLPRFV